MADISLQVQLPECDGVIAGERDVGNRCQQRGTDDLLQARRGDGRAQLTPMQASDGAAQNPN